MEVMAGGAVIFDFRYLFLYVFCEGISIWGHAAVQWKYSAALTHLLVHLAFSCSVTWFTLDIELDWNRGKKKKKVDLEA